MLVWVDVETTGLEPRGRSLLEVGMIVTDDLLNEVARTSVALQPGNADKYVAKANEPVAYKMHEDNGLWDEASSTGVSREAAQYHLTHFISDHCGDEKPVMAGSTVGFDRKWLEAKLPLVAACFHYRSVDVSSLKELNRRWKFAPKWKDDRNIHRALPDLEDSIAELKHYIKGLAI